MIDLDERCFSLTNAYVIGGRSKFPFFFRIVKMPADFVKNLRLIEVSVTSSGQSFSLMRNVALCLLVILKESRSIARHSFDCCTRGNW